LGVHTTYAYNLLGNLLAQTTYDAKIEESLTINYTYDVLGNCTSITDSGIYTEYCYNALKRK